MNHNQTLCASVQAKIYEQIERTEHLISLVPEGRADWVPSVNHDCAPAEAVSRIAAYHAGLDEGFAVIRDSDLSVQVPTVFVKNGEHLLTLLLGNLEHLINHKHQLFMYLKMMGVNVGSADLTECSKMLMF
jgi:hypothetical protein